MYKSAAFCISSSHCGRYLWASFTIIATPLGCLLTPVDACASSCSIPSRYRLITVFLGRHLLSLARFSSCWTRFAIRARGDLIENLVVSSRWKPAYDMPVLALWISRVKPKRWQKRKCQSWKLQATAAAGPTACCEWSLTMWNVWTRWEKRACLSTLKRPRCYRITHLKKAVEWHPIDFPIQVDWVLNTRKVDADRSKMTGQQCLQTYVCKHSERKRA